MLRHTFQAGAHRAPVSDVSLIWDLGSNIGSTLADMAHRHPGAKIVGVEPDPANHALAVENTSPWSDRVTVLRAAAWTSDGTVSLARDAGREAGSRIAEDGEQVEAVSLNGLLERFGAPSYVKMDVEGAERALLRENTEWAASARSISVELHGSYTAGDCIADLRRLGFSRVWEAEEPWWPRARGRPTVEAVR